MPISDYLAAQLVNHVTGGTPYPQPDTLYAALFSAMPSSAGGGTELTSVAAPGYSRAELSWAGAGNPRATSDPVYFPRTGDDPAGASAEWPVIVAVGLFESASGGNMLAYEALPVPLKVNSGDYLEFDSGSLFFALF